MKISFSIISIRNSASIQQTVKECDLVFIQKTEARGELLKEFHRLDRSWVEANIRQEKCVSLNSKLDRSADIVSYLEDRAKQRNSKYTHGYKGDELIELNTIYQSLPKGVPLELYSWDAMVDGDPPTVITIPHEN